MNLISSLSSRLLLGGKESSLVTLFSNAVPNTVFEKVFRNQVNNDSYNNDAGVARQRLISTPGTALWGEVASVGASQEYLDCKVLFLAFLILFFANSNNNLCRLIRYGRPLTDTILLP